VTFASAQLVRRRVALAALPLLAVIAVWAMNHAIALLGWAHRDGAGKGIAAAYGVTFMLFGWQALLFLSDRPARTTERQQRQLDALRVLVPVPSYNETPDALMSTVAAILAQARRPYMIYVVDDGSDRVDYAPLLPWFMQACREAGVVGRWQRQDNGGKREAQATALRETVDEHDIDVIWTVDSDARPDERCLVEGLKPFIDPKVRTVTSIILTENTRDSVLARMMDLVMVSLQLTDRSAMSAAGAVLVNSGASAFYRVEVILNHLDAYLNETFFGRRMKISDDSMLTLFGAIEGRTVQQPTSLVFTTMPDKFQGHWKQQTRWGRGSFIRSWWRMKYLPVNRFAYWWHLSRWFGFAVNTVALLYLFVVAPAMAGATWQGYAQLFGWSALVQVCLGAAIMLRYFSIWRSDQSLAYQLGTYALAPLAVLWSATVLRANRWYAISTCLNMGWQTRPATAAAAPARPDGWLPADNTQTAVMQAIR
jgi:hyaluronan synthase